MQFFCNLPYLQGDLSAVNGFYFTIISEDICSGIICQNGGTCVNRTATFWWCECEKGWTGRKCEYNGKMVPNCLMCFKDNAFVINFCSTFSVATGIH